MKKLRMYTGYALWVVALFVILLAGLADTWTASLCIIGGGIVVGWVAGGLVEE